MITGQRIVQLTENPERLWSRQESHRVRKRLFPNLFCEQQHQLLFYLYFHIPTGSGS